jgi:hypothetical protein
VEHDLPGRRVVEERCAHLRIMAKRLLLPWSALGGGGA